MVADEEGRRPFRERAVGGSGSADPSAQSGRLEQVGPERGFRAPVRWWGTTFSFP